MSAFHVPDIHCDGCIRALTAAVREVDPNASVSADLQSKQVQVQTTASDTAVAEAFRDAGFTVDPA